MYFGTTTYFQAPAAKSACKQTVDTKRVDLHYHNYTSQKRINSLGCCREIMETLALWTKEAATYT